MSSVALAVAGLAVSAAATGYSLSGAGNPTLPSTPNLGSESKEVSDAQAQFLPIQRGMAAAAQEGSKYTFSLPAGVDGSQYGFNSLPQGSTTTSQQQVFVPGTVSAGQSSNPLGIDPGKLGSTTNSPSSAPAGQWVNYNAADFQPGGQYADLPSPQLRTVTNNNGTYTVDFTGYGAGQTQSTIAEQAAAGQLKNEQTYDPQIIASALKQEQQADPEGTAARALESQIIQQQSGQSYVNPISEKLSSDIDSQVNAGKGLDPMEQAALDNEVSSSTGARGATSAGYDPSEPLTTGNAGVQRQLAGQTKGIGELSSGTTPEDVQYRQSQQQMADLSALMTGQTPQSQFGSLSGGQVSPQTGGQQLPTLQGNSQSAIGSAALQTGQVGNQIRSSVANPWLSGISTAINGANSAAQSGVFG